MKKRMLSLLVTLAMIFSMLPAAALAVEGEGAAEATGTITPAYTDADRFWGEGTSNAQESFVVALYEGDTQIATSSLINKDGIIDGEIYVTWSIPFDGEDSDYWDVEWAEGYPKYDMNPDTVKLIADGVQVATNNAQYNGPDNKNPIFAAKTDDDGKILSYIACDGFNLNAASEKLQSSITADDNIAILVPGIYDVPTGKDVTITGAVDGVVFDNIGARNMGGAKVTFNNVTFDYYPNANYTGLQHSGDLVYNDCTFNGQVFLYGTSETFNNCTFNQNSSDTYNVWTYGAKEVVFNGCTFNSAGKSVLIYAEGANIFNDVTVNDCDFIASTPVEGKAAVEMDSSLTAGINLTIDGETTVTGFGTGNVSGNSLWNNKKGSEDANNDITVTVDGETVLKPVVLGLSGSGTEEDPFLINNLEELIWFQEKVDEQASDGSTQFAGKYFELTADINLAGINWNPIGSMTGDHGSFQGVFDGNGRTISNLNCEQAGNGLGLFARTAGNAEIKNLTLENVTVKSTDNSNHVGAVVGNSFANTKITNVHVTGSIDISGRGYIGGISGHGYVVMDNVSVKGEGTISSTFWCAGGILGYGGEGTTHISNATVEGTGNGLTITSAAGGLGSIVGMAEDNQGTQPISGENLSAKNVDIKTYTGDFGDNYANYALGYLYGGNPTSELTGTLSLEDVTITTSNGEAPKVNDVVAVIGNAAYPSLSAAVTSAMDGDTVTLLADVTENVVITQQADLDLVIDGDGYTFTGVMTVFGNGRQAGAETLTVKNFDFVAANGASSCIVSPDRSVNNKYSYSHNVTVSDCTFTDLDGIVNCAAIRHEDGGDKNWTVTGCTVDSTMHSLLQVNNVAGKLTVAECTAESKNGINLNSCTNVEVTDCDFNVNGYAVRAGVNAGGNPDESKTFLLENSTLTTAGDDNDAAIILRASAKNAAITVKSCTVTDATDKSYHIAAFDVDDVSSINVVGEGSSSVTYNEDKTWTIGVVTYTVVFDSNGGSAIDAQEIVAGETAAKPAEDPTKSGYTFKGWYSDSDFTTEFSFDTPITEDTTVYAKWSKKSSGGGSYDPTYTITVEDTKNGDVTVSASRASSGTTVTITVTPDSGYDLDELVVLDKNGKEIEVTKKSNGKHTFKMPSGKVSIEAVFVEAKPFENPFADVSENDYYYDAVLWAAKNCITGGSSATTFSPDVTCTRAQTVTFLWRVAGSPEPETTVCPFDDVTPDQYYYDAVLWAFENGITAGSSATTFSPDVIVTRAQTATFLWKWAKAPTVKAGNPFSDVASDAYYHDAVVWAADEDITAGTSETTFSPDAPCLRGQIVTFLYRFLAE